MLIKDLTDEEKEKIKSFKCKMHCIGRNCPLYIYVPSQKTNRCLVVTLMLIPQLCLKDKSTIDIDISKLE